VLFRSTSRYGSGTKSVFRETSQKENVCGRGGGAANPQIKRECAQHEPVKKAEDTNDMTEEEDIEKSGQKVTESGDDDDQYDEDDDSSKKKVSKDDKEGRWNKHGDPNGTVKMSKAKDRMDYGDVDEDDSEEDEEEAEDESEEDVEKGYHGAAHSGNKITGGDKTRRLRALNKLPGVQRLRKDEENEAAEGLKQIPMRKGEESKLKVKYPPDKKTTPEELEQRERSKVQKGENMEEETQEENVQEYVTKAMVPIEEVDTIVKARTEEISKAYVAQFDEIKKSYDAKFAEMTSKIEKMEQETIRKGGSIIVIPQLLDPENKGLTSNADALAQMQAGQK
jgi:hypothetical protein